MGLGSVSYIQPEEVAAILKGPRSGTMLVVDVRDYDYAGGHIKGAVNITADEFSQDEDVDALVQKVRAGGHERVVFHCMLSQQRGPFCAKRFAERQAAVGAEGSPLVQVLQLGFQNFQKLYFQDESLVEDWDGRVWQRGYA